MKRRLYSNMKHMTMTFCISIVCVTMLTLMLRLTVFSDMAVFASPERLTGGEAVDSSAQFPCSFNTSIVFSSPQSKGDILVRNPVDNDYYITYTLLLPETQDSLIYTGFIEPGELREAATLNILLESGSYDCVVEISAYDSTSLALLGKEEWQASITIR